MTRDVELLAPDTPLQQVVRRMRSRRHSCALFGSDGIPAGIITERDLVAAMERMPENPGIASEPAAEHMSARPCTVRDDQTLFDALVIARAQGIRHLPVVDDRQKLVGLVTHTDLAQAHFHVIEQQQQLVERAILERTEQLLRANAELQSLSLEDSLMRIGNRRAMDVDMEHTHAHARRHRRPYCVVLLDIDFFKAYNDHYGHLQGDKTLERTASLVKDTIRKSDRLYRYGGEELLLLLPDTGNAGEGERITQRILKKLQNAALEHRKSPYGIITMSAGIAHYDPESDPSVEDWHDIVRAADERLYLAKKTGRNRAA